MSKPKPPKQSLADTLLGIALDHGPTKTFGAAVVAQTFRPATKEERSGNEAWRNFIRQVRSEAIGLARQGQIDIVRKGERLDPKEPFKGLYKMRLAETYTPAED